MDDAIARSYGMTSHPSLRFGQDDLMLDDDTVDRLLGGLAADDAPPGYGWVAGALAVLREPGEIDLGGEDLALALFRAARDGIEVVDDGAPGVAVIPPVGAVPQAAARPQSTASPAGHRRRAARAGQARRASLVAGAVAALSLISATSAAAMTGALPSPAQRAARDVMSVMGVHVPAPAPRVAPPATSRVGQGGGAAASTAPGRGVAGDLGVATMNAAPPQWRHHKRAATTLLAPPAPAALPALAGTGPGNGHGNGANGQGDTPAVTSSGGHGDHRHGRGHGPH